jgi:hypothetical protein
MWMIGYYILLIYDTQTTNINNTLNEFYMINPKIKFRMEEEQNNKINYLDTTIIKTHNGLHMGLYRKPTTTDHIIHNDSCHSYRHKKAAINYLINRMNKYPLTHTNISQEKTIKTKF